MIQPEHPIKIFDDADALKDIVVADFAAVLDSCLGVKDYHPSISDAYRLSTRKLVENKTVRDTNDKLQIKGYYNISDDELRDIFSAVMVTRFAGSSLKLYALAVHPEAYFRADVFKDDIFLGWLDGTSPLASHTETVKALNQFEEAAWKGHVAGTFGKQRYNPFGFTQEGVACHTDDFAKRIEALRQETKNTIANQYERDLAYKSKNELNSLFPDSFNDWFALMSEKKEFQSLTKDSRDAKLRYNAYVNHCGKNRNELTKEARENGFTGTAKEYLKEKVLARLQNNPQLEVYLVRRATYEEWLKIVTQSFSYTVFRYYMEFQRVKKREAKNERKIVAATKIADGNDISVPEAKKFIVRHKKATQMAADVKATAKYQNKLAKKKAQREQVLTKRQIKGIREALIKRLLEKRLGTSNKFIRNIGNDVTSRIVRSMYFGQPVIRPANLNGRSQSSGKDAVGLRRGGRSTCAAPPW